MEHADGPEHSLPNHGWPYPPPADRSEADAALPEDAPPAAASAGQPLAAQPLAAQPLAAQPLALRPLAELAREITSVAVRLAAATAGWLRLVGEFDAREGWGGYGIRSCAHWLAWQCGLSPSAAREHVRVARALRGLPLTAAAFDEGRVSYAKVRALTRVAEPGTEAELLQFAVEATASQLERTVRQWRLADDRSDGDDDGGEGAAPEAPREEFDTWWDDDGMLVLRARLNADNGAALLAGITSLVERAARRERAAARRPAAETGGGTTGEVGGGAGREGAGDGDAADRGGGDGFDDGARAGAGAPSGDADDEDELALARAATTARRCAALAALAGAAADADRRAGDPPRREVTIHVDAAVLADDAAAGRAYYDGGPALSPAQARRLLCEATVITMLEAGREVLAHGRTRRLASRAQRRALLRRDGGCARPGCNETRLERLHAHHLRHWLFGGRTDLPNLVLLCDTDHGLAHDLDLVMTRHDGRLIALTPDGRRVWGPADAAFTTGLTGLQPATPADQEPAPDQAPEAAGHAHGVADRGSDGVEESPGTADVAPAVPDAFIGVHPIDAARARRPRPAPGAITDRRTAPPTTDRRAAPSTTARAPVEAATISHLLFPGGEPPLPDAMHVNGERMNLAYAVSVLMGYRDFVHRMAAESGHDLAA